MAHTLYVMSFAAYTTFARHDAAYQLFAAPICCNHYFVHAFSFAFSSAFIVAAYMFDAPHAAAAYADRRIAINILPLMRAARCAMLATMPLIFAAD